MEIKKYLFIMWIEGYIKRMETDNLDDFREFCHYCHLDDSKAWERHKKVIKKSFNNFLPYEFTGNDVKYYIFPIEEEE